MGLLGELERILAYTVTHRELGIEAIGSLAELVPRIYSTLYPIVDGIVVLHTCNRLEVYIDAGGEAAREAIGKIEELLAGTPAEGKARVLQGRKAIEHLYRVACGLDSVMLGENEVLGQVKKAWLEAKRMSYTSRLLDMVFHGAVVAGRRARRETGISRGAVGYPEAAVELARRLLGGLDGVGVLVVGAGQAGKAVVESLCGKHEPGEVVIANRSRERAELLASIITSTGTCSGIIAAASIDEARRLTRRFDVAFVAVSGAPRLDWVLGKAGIVIDISTPPAVSGVPGRVYGASDVARIAEESLEARRREIPRVEAIIGEEIARLEKLIAEKRADKTVSLIMKAARRAAAIEALEALRAIENGRSAEEVLEKAFWSYTKKILHPLLVSLRQLARKGRLEALELIEKNYSELAPEPSHTTQLARGDGSKSLALLAGAPAREPEYSS